MAFSSWPGTVSNNALVETYREQDEDWGSKFQPDDGPELRATSVTVSTSRISYEVMWTATEWGNAMTFYRTTLSKGTKKFTVTNAKTGTSNELCEFVSPPERREVGFGSYRVSISLRRFN